MNQSASTRCAQSGETCVLSEFLELTQPYDQLVRGGPPGRPPVLPPARKRRVIVLWPEELLAWPIHGCIKVARSRRCSSTGWGGSTSTSPLAGSSSSWLPSARHNRLC